MPIIDLKKHDREFEFNNFQNFPDIFVNVR